MSGICGICETGAELKRSSLDAMFAGLALEGERPAQALAGGPVALGISPRWAFQQVAAVPGVYIAVDADLTNFADLKRVVSQKGHDVSRMTIAEVLAWLYILKGESFLDALSGEFALALWDEREQRLLLAIDRMAVKTLYWRQDGPRLLFASRVGAVRDAQEQPAEINPQAVMQFILAAAIPAPLSVYRGIERLRPGHLLVFDRGAVRQRAYWDIEYVESDDHDERRWARDVQQGLREAVHRYAADESPERTGAYLSGGTDSSSVVAFLNERLSPVNTFSIYFAEAAWNEIGYARATTERFQTRHNEACLGVQHAAEAIPKIAEYYDEPFANSSSIGAYWCARLAREKGVDTLFAGDGGDELFAGNQRYATDKRFQIYQQVPGWLRRGVIEPLVGLLPEGDGPLSLPRKYVRRANIPNPRRGFSYSVFFSNPVQGIIDPGLLSEVPPERWLEIYESHFRNARATSELNRHLYMDVKVTIGDNDLRKVVGTAELAGVRARFPLLDHHLAELSSRIPTSLKLKGTRLRYIFKKAMEGILPEVVLHKPKHGFGVPVSLWLLRDPKLNAMTRELLSDRRSRQRGYLQPKFYDKLLELHRTDHAKFYGEFVWSPVILELWHRNHYDHIRERVSAT